MLDRHDLMRAAVEAGEMVEAEGFAVDREAGVEAAAHPSRGEVPGRDVMARALEDGDAVEEDRREIDPFLVGEEPVGDFGAAEVQRSLRPPVGEPAAFVRVGDSDEAEIEDAVLEARDLVVEDRLEGRLGLGLVRSEREIRRRERGEDVVDAREQHHVRIEVERRSRTPEAPRGA